MPVRRRRARRGLRRCLRPGPAGGGRRVAAAPLRRHDARPVAGRRVVGPVQQRARLPAPPNAAGPGSRRGVGPRARSLPGRRRRSRCDRTVARGGRGHARAGGAGRAGWRCSTPGAAGALRPGLHPTHRPRLAPYVLLRPDLGRPGGGRPRRRTRRGRQRARADAPRRRARPDARRARRTRGRRGAGSERRPDLARVADGADAGRATFGSLVHGVLEHSDPDAAAQGGDLAAELRHHLTDQLVRCGSTSTPTRWWRRWSRCPTPRWAAGRRRDAAAGAAARPLTELEFELPMGGGDDRDHPAAGVLLGDLAEPLRRHLPAGDPVRGYVDRLAQPGLGGQPLRGYLTGFIDLTMRVGDRYLVCDYKTNWLARVAHDPDFVLRAHDYDPTALAEAMVHSDYPLQALLYSVVLHRYLRWRQPGYDPDRHLGGVLYLYLRGMSGPDTPVVDGHPCGVFSWRPPASLVAELSDLVDGRIRDRAVRAHRLLGPAHRPQRPGGAGRAQRGRAAPRRRRPRGTPADRADRRPRPSGWRSPRRSPPPWSSAARWGSTSRGRASWCRRWPGPTPTSGATPWPRRRPSPRERCASSTGWSTSTATTGWRSRSSTTSSTGRPGPAAGGRAGSRCGAGAGVPGGDVRRPAGRRRAAVRRWTTVITGGPGTGKTTTVARMLACSPTSRRGGDVSRSRSRRRPARRPRGCRRRSTPRCPAPAGHGERVAGLEAMTLHRLLGWRPDNTTRFRHDRGNRLKYDVVVVDESSMVELLMMGRLLEAMRPDTRLVLVGDPDQLTSVGAGAVLADLVKGYAGAPTHPSCRSPAPPVRRGDRDAGARAARRRRRRR